jgi:argininosuccinate lyase
VARGLAFRTAHELVGKMVRQLLAEQRDFSSLALAEWRRFSGLFEADVLALVAPARSVAARRTPQSTNPDAVRQALDETRAWLESVVAGSSSVGRR